MVNGDNDDDYEVEFYPYDTDNGILTSRIFDWWEGKSSVPRWKKARRNKKYFKEVEEKNIIAN